MPIVGVFSNICPLSLSATHDPLTSCHSCIVRTVQVGTPDSSRIWDGPAFRDSKQVVENSKECFRKLLQAHFPDPDILVNKDRMVERTALAVDNELPAEMLLEVSRVYVGLAEKITGMWVVPCDIILSGACTRMRTAACAVV